MTMANLMYPSAKLKIATGIIDLDTDTFYLALVTDAYTPNVAHDYFNDVTNEVVGTGYVAGGKALSGVTAGLVGSELRWNADNVVWAASTITARGAVIYKKRGGPASADELVCAMLFPGGVDIVSTAAPFTVAFDTGIIASFA